jgi:hypothetical protein
MKRVRKWTKAEKEWLGYKRKLANNKDGGVVIKSTVGKWRTA